MNQSPPLFLRREIRITAAALVTLALVGMAACASMDHIVHEEDRLQAANVAIIAQEAKDRAARAEARAHAPEERAERAEVLIKHFDAVVNPPYTQPRKDNTNAINRLHQEYVRYLEWKLAAHKQQDARLRSRTSDFVAIDPSGTDTALPAAR